MTREMNHIRRGTDKPLLLIHGLGGSWRSWNPIFNDLAAEREVIALDLPGFGDTPSLLGEVSIRTLADAVTEFLTAQDLIGIDAVGDGAILSASLVRRNVLWSYFPMQSYTGLKIVVIFRNGMFLKRRYA